MSKAKDAVHASFPLISLVALYQATHAPFLGVGLPTFLIDLGYDAVCTVVIAVLVTVF